MYIIIIIMILVLLYQELGQAVPMLTWGTLALMDVFKWMLTWYRSSFYHIGMLSLAYLKGSGVQLMEVLKWTLARFLHHESGQAVLCLPEDPGVELMDLLKWMLPQYSFIMNLGMVSLAYLKDSSVELMDEFKWTLAHYYSTTKLGNVVPCLHEGF